MMIVATASLHMLFERASHHASGVPSIKRITVVVLASWIVSLTDTQISERPSMRVNFTIAARNRGARCLRGFLIL